MQFTEFPSVLLRNILIASKLLVTGRGNFYSGSHVWTGCLHASLDTDSVVNIAMYTRNVYMFYNKIKIEPTHTKNIKWTP